MSHDSWIMCNKCVCVMQLRVKQSIYTQNSQPMCQHETERSPYDLRTVFSWRLRIFKFFKFQNRKNSIVNSEHVRSRDSHSCQLIELMKICWISLSCKFLFPYLKVIFIYKDQDIMFCDNTMRIRSCLSPIYSDAYCDA